MLLRSFTQSNQDHGPEKGISLEQHFSCCQHLNPVFSVSILKEKIKKLKVFNQQAVKMLGRVLGVTPQFNSGSMYQGSTLNTVLLAMLERETNTHASHTSTYVFYPEMFFQELAF